MKRKMIVTVTTVLVAALPFSPAFADGTRETSDCRVLCTPELKFEPTWSLENLFGGARVEPLNGRGSGREVRLARTTVFEVLFALDVPTELPWLGFTLEAAFPPFEDDNDVELEAELNFTLLTPERTGGWIDAHFDLVDKFSPAERPEEDDAYTHKLNFELDVALAAFRKLPEDRYLHNVEVELSLDYVATGLPHKGDVIGGRRYLEDASGWSLSLVLVFPVAPWPG